LSDIAFAEVANLTRDVAGIGDRARAAEAAVLAIDVVRQVAGLGVGGTLEGGVAGVVEEVAVLAGDVTVEDAGDRALRLAGERVALAGVAHDAAHGAVLHGVEAGDRVEVGSLEAGTGIVEAGVVLDDASESVVRQPC
jgi:hypothetical protein